jgi:ABC-type polysaccharide/polyol phosphate export permease
MINPLESHPKLTFGLVAVLVIPLAHYAVTLALYNKAVHSKSPQRTPPTVPHFLPIIGYVPWQFFSNPIEFFKSRWAYAGVYKLLECFIAY